jgi:hypothetical protein
MNFLPVAERELRALSRRPLVYRLRSGVGLAATLLCLGVLAAAVGQGQSPGELGRALFVTLTLLAFGAGLMAGPVLTADCLSEEKREGTLGLLFLTDLRGCDIVAGKMAALAVPALHGLLAVLPILGLCFFLGGVTGGEFGRVALVLVNTLGFSLAVGLLVSALSRDGRRALLATLGVILGVTFGLPALDFDWSVGDFAGGPLALPSPAFALQAVPDDRFAIAGAGFPMSLVNTLVVSCACIALASVCLPRGWQDRPAKPGPRDRFPPTAWSRIRKAKTAARRRRLLESNPVLWLACRNRRSTPAIWMFLGATAVLWVVLR